ncbi:MAG: diguanylate cyclase domain-containing protein [Thermodesulfobacteriota bacterium]
MKEIFKIDLFTEPDFQRFNSFLIKAADFFDKDPVNPAISIPKLTKDIRNKFKSTGNPVATTVFIEDNSLFVKWSDQRRLLLKLKKIPDEKNLTEITQHFSDKIHNASPELLRIQNQEIKKNLEAAKQKAESEINDIEKQLNVRKKELEEYMIKAETDSLTGLLNRRAFNQHLNSALKDLKNKNKIFCLLYLDLDFFKTINDTYGHSYGDKILHAMSMNMLNCIREKTDFAFRIGGDEFAIILFSDETIAARAAKKILNGIEHGISIGFTLAHPNDTPEIIAQRADMALYFSKDQGRSIVTVAHKPDHSENPSASSLEIIYNGKS